MSVLRSESKSGDLLSLVNPPLVISAAAEGLAGALVSGALPTQREGYVLALSSALLFGAGAVFGHYFDRDFDVERAPERPLPSGRWEPASVWQLGWSLLVPGILLAALTGRDGLLAAIGVALLVVLHAAVGKGIWALGFLTLAAARGLNFVLGMTAGEAELSGFWSAALPVTLYAAGWAVFRAARQPGAPPATAFVGLLHVVAGASMLFYLTVTWVAYRIDSLVFLLAFLGLTFPRFVGAVLEPGRPPVAQAVQYGFLGLTLMEASITGGYRGFTAGFMVAVACLPVYAALRKWPVSLILDRR